MAKYTSRPVTVEAVEISAESVQRNIESIAEASRELLRSLDVPVSETVDTSEGGEL